MFQENNNEEQYYPSYYAVIPANVRYANITDGAKLIYGEVAALASKEGVCWATNKYFADLYNVSKTTISLRVKELLDLGVIEILTIYKKGSKEIDKRLIKLVAHKANRIKKPTPPIQENLNTPPLEKLTPPPLENLKDNNTRNNTTSIYSEAEASGSLPPKGKKEKKKKEPKPIVIFTPELLEAELDKMESKENSHLDIIATFIREKKIKVLNSKQLELLIRRHCQPASQLSGAYSNKEIFRAMEKLQKDYEKEVDRGKAGSPVEWTLETVIKVLTK